MIEDDYKVEKAFAIGIEVGVLQLSKELGLLSEKVSEKKAEQIYGKELIKKWRSKKWIILYSTGNEVRSKYYYKRSELETACRMADYKNLITPNKLKETELLEQTNRLKIKKTHNEKSTTKKNTTKKFQRLKKLHV